jgi:hypothetical protein
MTGRRVHHRVSGSDRALVEGGDFWINTGGWLM